MCLLKGRGLCSLGTGPVGTKLNHADLERVPEQRKGQPLKQGLPTRLLPERLNTIESIALILPHS